MPTASKRATVATVSTDPEDIAEELNEEYPVGSPANVDATVAALQDLMAKQQAQIDSLLAEKGIPSDPVAAQIQALQDHLTAQANANPRHSEVYAPALSYVGRLSSEGLTTNKAAKAERLLADLRGKVPGHELAYAHDLARDLHTMTLDPDEDED